MTNNATNNAADDQDQDKKAATVTIGSFSSAVQARGWMDGSVVVSLLQNSMIMWACRQQQQEQQDQ